MDSEITQDASPITIETPAITKPPRKVVPMTEKRLAHLRLQNERRSAEAKIRHLERKTTTKADRERAKYELLHAKYGLRDPEVEPLAVEPLVAEPEPPPTPPPPPPPHRSGPPLRYAPMPMLNFV